MNVELQHGFKDAADTTFPSGLDLNSYAGSTNSEADNQHQGVLDLYMPFHIQI